MGDREITWGDTHHPALSETNGDYDGQFLFINDKANPRLAVIDLHDFETKQIVVNPIFQSEHGGAFVSENTEYVIEAVQYPAPLGGKFSPLERFNEDYRGGVTYWTHRSQAVVLHRAAALQPGPLRLRKAGELGLVVHQLLLQ
jgi:nitrous-oxide reductase